jgi:hypothetical protein
MKILGLPLCVLALSVLSGCADPPSDGRGGRLHSGPDAGDPQNHDDPPDEDGGGDCVEGASETCACSETSYGQQTCTGGHFGSCEDCKEASPESHCVAGSYAAKFIGMYRSSASSFGGITPGEDNPTETEATFTLSRDGDGEFYSVHGGCFRPPGQGMWEGEGDSSYGHTFEMVGDVDCKTGVIDFDFRLTYLSSDASQFGGWSRFFSQGKMTGRYDPVSRSFLEGKWELHEAKPLLAAEAPGGMGTFTATLVEEREQVGSPEDACFDVAFPADLAPLPVPTPE